MRARQQAEHVSGWNTSFVAVVSVFWLAVAVLFVLAWRASCEVDREIALLGESLERLEKRARASARDEATQ